MMPERKTKIMFIIKVTLVFMITVSLIMIIGYRLSLYYYAKAKNENQLEAKLNNFLSADIFWPSYNAEIAIAKIYEDKSDYEKSAIYYQKAINHGGLNGYLKAKYLDGQYKTAVNIKEIYSGEIDHDSSYWLALSELKLGDLKKARDLLENCRQSTEVNSLRVIILSDNAPDQLLDNSSMMIETGKNNSNQYLLAYNELNKRGFPQGAFSLIKEGYEKNKLNRDGLLTLAQAQIEAKDYHGAFTVLRVALRDDAYYPQTYRQLIKVGIVLNQNTSEYKKRLDSLTW